MANDLMNELGNTYESNYAAAALRESKWQNPAQQNSASTDYGTTSTTDNNNPFAGDMKTNTNINNNSQGIAIDDLDDEFLKIRDEIRNEISIIVNNATSVKNLSGKYKIATPDEYKQIMTKMDTIVQKNAALTTQIKWRIQTEKQNLAKTCDNVNSLKVREFNSLVMNFKKSCNIFSQSLSQFDSTVRGISYIYIYTIYCIYNTTHSKKQKN